MKIALDVDDVIAAFTLHVHNYYSKPLESKVDYWSVPKMDEILGVGWFKGIAGVKDFWDTIPVLSCPSNIDFEISCYMSSFPQEMYESRVTWLRNNGFPKAPLIVCSDKLSKCLELGVNILIDDKPEMMRSLLNSPVRGIHFITHYAGFEPVGNYVTSLKQVKQYL